MKINELISILKAQPDLEMEVKVFCCIDDMQMDIMSVEIMEDEDRVDKLVIVEEN